MQVRAAGIRHGREGQPTSEDLSMQGYAEGAMQWMRCLVHRAAKRCWDRARLLHSCPVCLEAGVAWRTAWVDKIYCMCLATSS